MRNKKWVRRAFRGSFRTSANVWTTLRDKQLVWVECGSGGENNCFGAVEIVGTGTRRRCRVAGEFTTGLVCELARLLHMLPVHCQFMRTRASQIPALIALEEEYQHALLPSLTQTTSLPIPVAKLVLRYCDDGWWNCLEVQYKLVICSGDAKPNPYGICPVPRRFHLECLVDHLHRQCIYVLCPRARCRCTHRETLRV